MTPTQSQVDAIQSAARGRVVNGITERSRKTVRPWREVSVYGIMFLPDIVALFALVASGIHWLMQVRVHRRS